MKRFIEFVDKWLGQFYQRIIQNTSLSVEQLSLYRIFIGLFFLLNPPKFSWLGDVPPSFYKPLPLTITSFLDSFPPATFFKFLDGAILVLLVFIILGIKTRISSLALFFFLLIGNSFTYSFGKIDHHIFSSLLFLFLSFTNAGRKYSIWTDKIISYQNLSIAVFGLCLVFGFFTAGYEKAFVWLDFDLSTSGINYWFYGNYVTGNSNHLLADEFLQVPSNIKEVMDYTAVLFELSGLFFLMHSRRSWLFYLLLASFFHLANTLILNISFLSHFVVYGIWLLSPVILKDKLFFILLAIPVFIKGLLMAVVLWVLLLIVSIVSRKRGIYFSSGKGTGEMISQ